MSKSKTKSTLFAMTFTAVMVAMSVILCRYLGFSPENTSLRFEIGFLPIAIVAHLFGPFYSGAAYLLSDAIGSLASGYAPDPYLAACQLCFGVVMGLFLWKKPLSLPRISICFLVIAVSIEFFAKTPWFIIFRNFTPGLAFGTRAITAFANLPLRIVSLYIFGKAAKKPIERIFKMNSSKNFKNYANSFQAVTVPGLERISALLNYLGNPEKKLKFIHVAGTNGKGSVCANLASILKEDGRRVGKYISPNLIKVNERISVNGVDISDGELSALLDRIEPLSERVKADTGLAPTQFEIWTAAAMLYFYERQCDIVVLEVGLGGELDATNVIPRNELAIITRLGLDHTAYLGNTISSVAAAKAGIIKEDTTYKTVITANQEPEALSVIAERCGALGLALTIPLPTPVGAEDIYERFTLPEIGEIRCGIGGYHQIENASLAATAALVLGIDPEIIRAGIEKAQNPARFELIRREPTVIYDGGHNENGIDALVKSVKHYYGEVEKTVIFACMQDKDIDYSLKALNTPGTEFIFTTVLDNPRADTAEGVLKRAEAIGISGYATGSIAEAYERAVMRESERGGIVLICGSLYLYRDLYEKVISKFGKE